MKKLIITFIIALISHAVAFAQPSQSQKVVKLTNGNEYIGVILSDDGREILIETTNLGKIYVSKSEVKSITQYDQEDFSVFNEEKVKSTAFSTRYTFTTNALPIKKKDNYYMINLWGPEFHIALADNFNVGVMTSWIGSPFALAAKYSFQTKSPKVNFSIGEIAGTAGYLNLGSMISLSFGNVTFGDRDKNITLAGGYGYFNFNGTKAVPGTYVQNINGGYTNINTGTSYNDIPYTSRKATQGFIGSVGAHLRLSDKSSFVFDSMFGLMNMDNTTSTFNYSTTPVIVSVTPTSKQVPFFLFMPGLRIDQEEGKAVQFCIAEAKIDGHSFPFPYITWFRKL